MTAPDNPQVFKGSTLKRIWKFLHEFYLPLSYFWNWSRKGKFTSKRKVQRARHARYASDICSLSPILTHRTARQSKGSCTFQFIETRRIDTTVIVANKHELSKLDLTRGPFPASKTGCHILHGLDIQFSLRSRVARVQTNFDSVSPCLTQTKKSKFSWVVHILTLPDNFFGRDEWNSQLTCMTHVTCA